jgi:hypothetical protein
VTVLPLERCRTALDQPDDEPQCLAIEDPCYDTALAREVGQFQPQRFAWCRKDRSEQFGGSAANSPSAKSPRSIPSTPSRQTILRISRDSAAHKRSRKSLGTLASLETFSTTLDHPRHTDSSLSFTLEVSGCKTRMAQGVLETTTG